LFSLVPVLCAMVLLLVAGVVVGLRRRPTHVAAA
jgi:hypothetical protein